MSKAYQFELHAKKVTEGSVRYGNAGEELCNTLYLRKGIVKLMEAVFPNGMPPGLIVTIQANYDAQATVNPQGEVTVVS